MNNYLDYFLEQRMNSVDGEEIKGALETVSIEEKNCLELFKVQIRHCQQQLALIGERIAAGWHTHELMTQKRAFEEQEFVLNVAAQIQQCSYETKGIQKLLYFEKNESSRERIAVDASVMMYEWCEDLNELTGKKYQDITKRLLSEAALAKTRIARKKLADFFKQEKPVLSEIRHNAGAHREHDFMKQMEVLESVGWSDTIERLHRFEELTLGLGKTMKPLMEAGLKKIGEAFGK